MVRLQTRTDVLKSDQKVLITELHLRIGEVNRLNQAVEDLRIERERDRTSLENYDRQMKVCLSLYWPQYLSYMFYNVITHSAHTHSCWYCS